MSQDFRFRYQELRDGDPTRQADGSSGHNTEQTAHEQYGGAGHARNLCFVWPDGRRLFLNYSYLVSCWLLPDEGRIDLQFTSHVVQLEGVRLESLFDALLEHRQRIITCTEERYNATEETEPVVNRINILRQ